MTSETTLQQQAATWFSQLQSDIIAELEALEKDYCDHENLPYKGFARREWFRSATDNQAVPTSRKDETSEGGGGLTALLEGQLFEKAGVNFSKVYGQFAPNFRQGLKIIVFD